MIALPCRSNRYRIWSNRGLRVPLREEILISWCRSKEAGLDPQHLQLPYIEDVDREALLLRASRPVVDQLLSDLGAVNMSVVITDNRAQVLDRRETNRTLTMRLESIGLVPGSVFAEESIGTNGIGSALTEGKSFFVEGSEHFSDAFTGTACAAAPILDPKSGRIVGGIDLSCEVPDAHPLMLPLARRAARLIELRLIDESSVREKLVLQQFLQKQRSARGPVVFLGTGSMFSNAAASRLVTPADEAVLREHAQRIVSGRRPGFEEVLLSTGQPVLARCEKVLDGSESIGVILEVRAAPSPEPGLVSSVTKRWTALTNTERNVAELAIDGFTNKQIGERLFTSAYTVDSHVRSIFRKLGVRSRLELTRVALVPEHQGLD